MTGEAPATVTHAAWHLPRGNSSAKAMSPRDARTKNRGAPSPNNSESRRFRWPPNLSHHIRCVHNRLLASIYECQLPGPESSYS